MDSRKRKVQFAEPEEKPEPPRFKTDLQPDSDEEDDGVVKKSEHEDDMLDEDNIEGQEEETIRFDGDIALTPFNLKEELEEGHFDKQGNYIANKSDADITDGWLDSVDWGRVSGYKDPEAVIRGDTLADEGMDDDDDDDEEEDLKEKADTSEMIEQMIAILKPGETVLRCLRRLGGSQKKRLSTAERWKRKKQAIVEEECSAEEAESKANLLKLTGLADVCLQAGDFQIYEKTFEQLTYELRSQQEAKKARLQSAGQFEDAVVNEPSKPGDGDIADDDDDDELEAAFKSGQQTNQSEVSTNQNPPPSEPSDLNSKANDTNTEIEEPPLKKAKADSEEVTTTPKEISLSDEVQWMYRSSADATTEELVGPFTSEQMLAWSEDGTFEKMDGGGAMCCKVGSEGAFYHSKRIDFELYT